MWTAKPTKNRLTTALAALDFYQPECLANVARLPRRAALPETAAEPERLFSHVALVATTIPRTEERLEGIMHAQSHRHLHLMVEKCWGVPQKQKEEGLCPFSGPCNEACSMARSAAAAAPERHRFHFQKPRLFYECMYSRVSMISIFVKKLTGSGLIRFSEALRVQWYNFQQLTALRRAH